jgi:hypothetical protein
LEWLSPTDAFSKAVAFSLLTFQYNISQRKKNVHTREIFRQQTICINNSDSKLELMTESLNLCSTRITKNLTTRNKSESNPTQRDYGLAPSKSRSEGDVAVRTVIRRRERRAARAVALPPHMPRPVPAPHREGDKEEDPVPNPDDSPELPNRHKNQTSPMAGNRGIRRQRTSSCCEAANPARREMWRCTAACAADCSCA